MQSTLRNPAVILLFASAALQGLTLVSFPALANVLKATLHLTDAGYGALFIPQVSLTAVAAVAGGALTRRIEPRTLLSLGMLANGLSQLALLLAPVLQTYLGATLAFAGTALLGVGFGMSAAPLNRYPVLLFPTRPDSALAALHTALGVGLAMGPVIASAAAATLGWSAYPIGNVLAAVVLAGIIMRIDWPTEIAPPVAAAQRTEPRVWRAPGLWLLLAGTVIYAVVEGVFSNWALIYLAEDRRLSAAEAAQALSGFWAALAAGRLSIAWLATRCKPELIWLTLPVLMSLALLGLPAVGSPASGILAYALAGLACSGFFPLTVGRATAGFPKHAALVSSLMVAALMFGVGVGSFGLGAARNWLPLVELFRWCAALPVTVFLLSWAALRVQRKSLREADMAPPPSLDVVTGSVDTEDTVTCPACGGINPAEAVFCINHACHKALGEFDYVLEELDAAKTWIEHLADRVTEFAGRPHFVIVHALWFMVWIAANSGQFPFLKRFDEYPYSLLGIVLAIEAILITGFLLISQNRQQAYADKRAELDYEINIRSYRKLLELEKRLNALTQARVSD